MGASASARGPVESSPVSTSLIVFGLAFTLYLATTGGSMATDIMSYEVTKDIVDHRGDVLQRVPDGGPPRGSIPDLYGKGLDKRLRLR